MASTHNPSRHEPSLVDPVALGALADAMVAHEIRLIAGLDAAGLADALAIGPAPRRPVLRLDLGGAASAAARIERAIDQLARAVAGLWPFLWGGEDFSTLRDQVQETVQ